MGILAFSLYNDGLVSHMFYCPDRKVYSTPQQFGGHIDEVSFSSTDGTALHGWFLHAKDTARGTVIHFHGNAQNLTAHVWGVWWLPDYGFNVFIVDYRGYGKSKGRPTRQGLFMDAQAAIAHAFSRDDIDTSRIFVFGQSLGAAVAIPAVAALKDRYHVKGVAVEAGFYSYRSMVRDKIGEIPLLSLLRVPLSFALIGNSLSPGPVIGQLSPTPLLVIHGTSDRVVAYHQGQRLFEEAGEPKEFLRVEGGFHLDGIDRMGPEYQNKLSRFFTQAPGDTG